jgi:hypothetical protein
LVSYHADTGLEKGELFIEYIHQKQRIGITLQTWNIFMALKSSVRTAVEKKLEEYEGRYNHMYLDSKEK